MADDDDDERELLERALEVAPDDRPEFLSEQCRGDAELRRRIERRIADEEVLPTIIASKPSPRSQETPTLLDAGGAFESTDPTLPDQRVLDFDGRLEPGVILQERYAIVTLIGHGGMGAVYTATDLRLRSTVALKQRLGRSMRPSKDFEHEGQILSNLRHPALPVVTDYFVDEHGEFLAMQYIAGKDLWQRLEANGQPFPIEDVLAWGDQVLRVLEYLHGQPTAVLHRDIKPQNLKLAPDGSVILLDFGLSKGATALMSTEGAVRSIHGYTPHFAPLEQVRGSGTDARCDLYGLAATLYCLATITVPPDAVSRAESVLDGNSDPLAHASELNPAVPVAVADLLGRAMALKRDARPASAAAMRRELDEIRRRLQIGSAEPVAWKRPLGGLATVEAGDDTRIDGATTEAQIDARSTVRLRGRWWTLAIAGACLAAVVAAVGIGLYSRHPAAMPLSPTAAPPVRSTRFTVSGNVDTAAISPDGRYVAYVTTDRAGSALWVRQVTASSAVQVLPPSQTRYRHLAFSADGSAIRYVPSPAKWSPGRGSFGVYQIPMLGGTPKRIVADIESAIDFEGRDRLAYIRVSTTANGQSSADICVCGGDGTGEQRIASVVGKGVECLALSPDGTRVAVATFALDPDAPAGECLVEIPTDGGEEHALGTARWDEVSDLVWTPDGGTILVSATPQENSVKQIWRVAYPSGETEQLTNGMNGSAGLSLTTDLATLCTTQVTTVSGLRIADLADASRGRLITQGTNDGMLGVVWTRDGRLVYASGAAPESHLWVCDVDGTRQRQLTRGPGVDTQPALSSDGKTVYFASNGTGAFHVFAVPIDGGEPRQITNGSEEWWPQSTADGGSLIFEGAGPGTTLHTVWRTAVDSQTPTELFDLATGRPCIAPGGRSLALLVTRPGTELTGLCTASVDGGNIRRLVPIAGAGARVFDGYQFDFSEPAYRWTPDGKGLVYSERSETGTRLLYQPIGGGRQRPLAVFEDDFAVFDISPDGRQIVYQSQTYSSDVVLVTGLLRPKVS